MSVEAITWALKQPIKPSSMKFVLVVLANCASAANGQAWPSIPYLSEATGQDRKTVIENLSRLVALGLIENTGKRIGLTGRVVIYRLRTDIVLDGNQLAMDLGAGRNSNSPENGTVPNDPENGTLPAGNSPVFSLEQSRKRDSEPSGTLCVCRRVRPGVYAREDGQGGEFGPATAASIELRHAGFPVTSSNPTLLAALDEGVTVEHLVEFTALDTMRGKTAGYLIGAARRTRAQKPADVRAGNARAGPGTSRLERGLQQLQALAAPMDLP